jgi:hypothetical protein
MKYALVAATGLALAGCCSAQVLGVYQDLGPRCAWVIPSGNFYVTYAIASTSEHLAANVTTREDWMAIDIVSDLDTRLEEGLKDGCRDGVFTNGYTVCLTPDGGNVHNGKGKHQRCATDDTLIGIRMLGVFNICSIPLVALQLTVPSW